MSKFADILPIIGRSFPLLLTYGIPEAMTGQIKIGAQVIVPLGRRTAIGYVVSIHNQPPPAAEIKSIETIVDAPSAFSQMEVNLARWIAEHYCCSLALALRPFVSDTGVLRVRRRLQLTSAGEVTLRQSEGGLEEAKPCEAELGSSFQSSGNAVEAESLRSRELLAALRAIKQDKGRSGRRAVGAAVGKRAAAVLRQLKERGLVEETTSLVSTGAAKFVEMVSLAIGKDKALQLAEQVSARAPRQAAALELLAGEQEEISLPDLIIITKSAAPIRNLARQKILKIRHLPSRRIPWPEAPTDDLPVPRLTPQQQIAADQIVQAVREGRPQVFLLFGVTGSGKTEIFLRAIIQALEKGKQALLLVPEILLTAQVVGLLRSRFGEKVAVIHSAMSPRERRDEKARVRSGEARVIVGPRSALFSPFTDIGLVVVDEEQDASYKQEQEPRYNARDAALKLAEQFGCPCVLAGATPSLESFYLARKGIYTLLRLEERPEGRALPQVHLLDLRGKSRRPQLLLPELVQALSACLQAEGQAIIFLNRRGHSTFLFCPQCGYSFRCPHCQVALIFHKDEKRLRCHHCDNRYSAPLVCPNCQGTTLRFSGFGTQRVAEELAEIFPAARVSRMDRDTAATKGAHVRVISDFRTAASDLLVGTQMVSKGLHFPGVTVVGVVAADISLNTPDFRAGERTFQLLTQVAGRAGRGSEPGEVYVQTYHPDHYAVQAARNHDYDTFYAEEIKQREEACYPPFCELANIIVSAPDCETSRRHCEELAEAARTAIAGAEVEILGPAPAPLSKLKDRYRHHFLLRAFEPGLIQKILHSLPEELSSRGKIHVIVDVDPVSLM